MRIRMFVFSLLAALALIGGGFARVTAQDASPVAEDLMLAETYGLPEIEVTLTDAGFESSVAETAAGWHVVSFTNNSSAEDAVNFIQLPEGRTLDDITALAEAAGGPPPEGEDDMASPAAMDMASPEAGGPPAGEDPFAWLFETHIAGGTFAAPGTTGQVIVELRAGAYAVASDCFSPAAPTTLTVTGDAMASPAAAAITADATITEVGEPGNFFEFQVTGDLQPGTLLIEIVNDSPQPHFVEMLRSAEPVTAEQVMQVFMTEEGATPPAGVPDPESWVPTFYASIQSTGTTQYVVANLEAGYHVLACFVPDPAAGGVPHAFEGMIEVVPVGV